MINARYEILVCPFCYNGEITVKVFGGSWEEKRGARTSLGKSLTIKKSKIVYVVQNDCDKCGKLIEDIEKAL